MKNTPFIHSTGVYKFRAPWVNKPGIIYECLAIRSFADIYKLGDNVYTLYYEPLGLIEGRDVPKTSDKFSFAEEVDKNPNIITLKGSDGVTLYVPDTFIEEVPNSTLVPYYQTVLAVSLGALPEYVDISNVSDDVMQLVSARLGIEAKVQTGIVPIVNNPTPEEHSTLEKARLEGIPEINANLQMRFDESQKQLAVANEMIRILERVIIEHGIADQI